MVFFTRYDLHVTVIPIKLLNVIIENKVQGVESISDQCSIKLEDILLEIIFKEAMEEIRNLNKSGQKFFDSQEIISLPANLRD